MAPTATTAGKCLAWLDEPITILDQGEKVVGGEPTGCQAEKTNTKQKAAEKTRVKNKKKESPTSSSEELLW